MRVAIATLGCKVNTYDGAAIETRLRAEGCEIVPFETGADAYVVNGCTVTDRADAESRQLARRARRFNPAARVIVTGCFAQVRPQTAAIPEVDHVVGLNRLPDVVRAVRGELAAAARVVVDDLRAARQVKTLGAEVFGGQTRAFLKIQEGCDLFCSFCIVPFARGAGRSVPPRQVLEQLQVLAERGHREVVLTGVHLGGYGADLSPALALCDLLEMIAEQPPVPRLRLGSLDPPEVTPRLLELVARTPALCAHVHMPIQSGDDAVLARMRRRYDAAMVRDVAAAVRQTLPDAALGTDVIAGFPGESESEFENTERLLAELPFTYFHVFPYSKRAGTTAAKRTDHLPARTIKDRAARLRRLGERKRAAFAATFVGRTLDVLVEGAGDDALDDSADGLPRGYARNYQRVEIIGAGATPNREVSVRVLGADGARLHGRVD